jgi:hypothetical protein
MAGYGAAQHRLPRRIAFSHRISRNGAGCACGKPLPYVEWKRGVGNTSDKVETVVSGFAHADRPPAAPDRRQHRFACGTGRLGVLMLPPDSHSGDKCACAFPAFDIAFAQQHVIGVYHRIAGDVEAFGKSAGQRQAKPRLETAVNDCCTELPVQGAQDLARTALRQVDCNTDNWFHELPPMWTFEGIIQSSRLAKQYGNNRLAESTPPSGCEAGGGRLRTATGDGRGEAPSA